jgi:hypothetical protein
MRRYGYGTIKESSSKCQIESMIMQLVKGKMERVLYKQILILWDISCDLQSRAVLDHFALRNIRGS